MTGAVFDCMIFVQALANEKGPARACYQLVQHGTLALYVSPTVLAEAREVMCRPKLRKKLPALTPEAVDAFLRDVAGHAVTLSGVPKVFKLARDPKDERYVDLALAAKVRYLVSRDNDLLDLMQDEDFRRHYPELAIIDPATLLRELRPASEPGMGPEGQGRVNGAD